MNALKAILLVGAGGGIGSIARYGLTSAAVALGLQSVAGTFAANTLGCFAGGLLLGLVPATREPADPWRLLLVVGVLGGLTTFSAFSIETVNLMRDGKMGLAATNVAANLVLGLAGVWAGYAIAKA